MTLNCLTSLHFKTVYKQLHGAKTTTATVEIGLQEVNVQKIRVICYKIASDLAINVVSSSHSLLKT